MSITHLPSSARLVRTNRLIIFDNSQLPAGGSTNYHSDSFIKSRDYKFSTGTSYFHSKSALFDQSRESYVFFKKAFNSFHKMK